jgi:hypothetical protein
MLATVVEHETVNRWRIDCAELDARVSTSEDAWKNGHKY